MDVMRGLGIKESAGMLYKCRRSSYMFDNIVLVGLTIEVAIDR